MLEEVRRDFSYFSADGSGEGLKLRLHLQKPSFDAVPPIPAAFYTPRNVCFRHGRVSYIDYFGKGLAFYDSAEKVCRVYSLDRDLIHEIAYHFILSSVGQYLDKRGIHRLHALGVSYHGRGILILLPSGGGKSTMALKLLQVPGFLLLGEDTPLIDRRGNILPFPLRIGVQPEHNPSVPPRFVRIMKRMEFEPKKVIDIEAFQGKLGEKVRPELIFLGERNLGDVSEIVPCGAVRTFKTLVKNMVIGLGVYQGLEFMLERSTWEIMGKFGVVSSRLFNSINLIANLKTYRFVLGRNMGKNYQTLIDFLEQDQY